MLMPTIILSKARKHDFDDKHYSDAKHQFGLCQTINLLVKSSQEDTVAWHTFKHGELTELSPPEIGHRLWTAYQNLNSAPGVNTMTAGSTASTTVVKGPHLITATLGDTVAFAVVYDKEGKVARVQRLNKKTHKPSNPEERDRIIAAGGSVTSNKGDVPRVGGALAVSRAFGDADCKGVCAEAHIDVTTLSDDEEHVQIVTASDGLTDGAGHEKQCKEDHEEYLKQSLNKMNNGKPGLLSEADIAKKLVAQALSDRSRDNISVAIQTIKSGRRPATKTCMIGIYDGHGGSSVSDYIAEHVVGELTRQLSLSAPEYQAQTNSVIKKRSEFERDNPHPEIPMPSDSLLAEADDIVNQLTALTTNDMWSHSVYIDQSPERRNLRTAATTLVSQINSANVDFKSRLIDLKTYRKRCEKAVDACNTSFQNFRGNTIWQKYFAPLIRQLFSCIRKYQQELELDKEVNTSVQKISIFKRKIQSEKPSAEITPPIVSPSPDGGG